MDIQALIVMGGLAGLMAGLLGIGGGALIVPVLRDASGAVVGAKNVIVGSVEYDYRFKPAWTGAIFFDEGNAVDEFSDPKERGAGFGLRWHSPIGPVRVDLASALTRDGHPWHLHLNIGPDL